MKQFLANRWFLVLLTGVLVVGVASGQKLQGLADYKLARDLVVVGVLFLMALPLEPRVIWRIVRRPVGPLVAVFMTFVVSPPIAWLASLSLSPDLGQGLLVAATTPCTLASAAVWTRRAGGNDAVATLATVITNASCFVVTPLWLSVLLGRNVDSSNFNFVDSVVQLGQLVVLPMVLAQIVRLAPLVGEFATRRKIPLSILAQLGILYMVLVGAIQTGSQMFGPLGGGPAWTDLLLMLVAVNAVHLSTFWGGWTLSRWLKISKQDQIAVGFAGSQKTQMIGLKISLDLQVSILPMVAFHVCQLLVDTLIADRIARSTKDNALDQETRSP